jgi:CHAT domain-containing protein/tetratricopeptide (TPR) repeat protein
MQNRDTESTEAGSRLIAEGQRLYQHHTTEDLHKAFSVFESARKYCVDAGDHSCEELSLTFLGIVSHDLGEYEQAQTYDRQAFAVAVALQDLSGQARNLTNLAVALAQSGNHGEAADALERALEIRREIPDLQGMAKDLQNLGALENILGNFPRSQQALEQSLALYLQQNNKVGQSAIAHELADTLMKTQQYATALQRIEQALRLDTELTDARGQALDILKRGQIRRNLGDAQGAWDDFENAAQRFREINDRVGEASALGNLGIVAELIGSYRQALEYYQKALADVGDAVQPELLWRIHRGQGASFWKLNQPDKAEQEYRMAVASIEKMRSTAGPDVSKISYFDTKEDVFAQYIELLFDEHKDVEALEVAEAGRARAFADLLQSQGLGALVGGSTANAADAKHLAAIADSSILEYFLTGRGLAIWLVRPDGQIFSKLVIFQSQTGTKHREVSTLVSNLRDDLNVEEWQVSRFGTGLRSHLLNGLVVTHNSQPTGALTETTRRLYHILIPPEIETHLPAQQANLIIVPHEELFLLPFAMLQSDDGRMLIDRFRLSISPSITVLAETDKRHRARNFRGKVPPSEVLIMGNPRMPFLDGVQMNPLEGTATEATAVASMFGTHALTQGSATEAAFKRESANKRIIHLATHGMADDANPMGSFVALAPTAGEDGLLTAADVAKLRLTADLVVLSACQTGLGHVTGDGVIGLSRSFILAGADSVVVSLWSVDDDATATLMQEFYKGITRGKYKADALRDAMQSVRQQSPDPYKWAPFLLIGEPE